ncbi:hypothetical protein FNJ84_14030 [Paracoccus sp. M683]|uniref:hypothetical protein n=1 Tax=Paracoccus sp. M683 TaxID=2594268 RepID=UPI00117F5CF8|nr:hypothetical protein [Paracoccus sp. M683]TRW95962.1 hypothetical protein FNJ84_14030 [Paracoccus sp. M683]
MAIHSVGDQARAFVLQSQSARLRNTLQVLTDELSSGIVADRAGRVSGNTTQLHHFETQIALLNQYKSAGAEAAASAEAIQNILGALQKDAAEFNATLLTSDATKGVGHVPLRVAEAQGLFETAVGRLNSSIAGLHLFSGLATDTPALIEPDLILDEIKTLTAGMTTAADVEAAITGWFDASPGGGGFLDFAYRGTMGEPRLAQIADDRVIAFATSAATPAIRELLKSYALTAVADSGAIAADSTAQLRLIERTGEKLRSNDGALLDEMGRVGLLESLADRFSTEHTNALAIAEIGRANLITADPFQTATALQEVQTQMQTLYTLTARLSGLRLVEYLR